MNLEREEEEEYDIDYVHFFLCFSPYVLHDQIITIIKEKAEQHQSRMSRKRVDIRCWRV